MSEPNAAQLRALQKKLQKEQDTLVSMHKPVCGNCGYWMTRGCIREFPDPKKSRVRVVAMTESRCNAFELQSHWIEWQQTKIDDIESNIVALKLVLE